MQNQQRLDAFEAMLAAVLEEYNTVQRKMEQLKSQGRERSATFRQLMAQKLTLQAILARYRAYGLLD